MFIQQVAKKLNITTRTIRHYEDLGIIKSDRLENNYRVYDDRVGETTRFTYRSEHDWYWLPLQAPHEVSMLKCYDSVTDGSVSRWSFHSACIDPTAPEDARCRKNVVVRSFVFF